MAKVNEARLAEWYTNSLYIHDRTHLVARWWAHERILVGGSLIDNADWNHLRKDFGITALLNVETEHSDVDKGVADDGHFCECQFPDNGSAPGEEFWATVLLFAKRVLHEEKSKIYIHCQMGGSRSPAVGYAVLRHVFGLNKYDALLRIQEARPDFGEHKFHKSYMDSADLAMGKVE